MFFRNYSRQNNEALLDSILRTHIEVFHASNPKELNPKPPDGNINGILSSKERGMGNVSEPQLIDMQLGVAVNGLEANL